MTDEQNQAPATTSASQATGDSEEVMERHHCDAIVITCMDFRFQKYIEEWEKENLGDYQFDRIALGGACHDFFAILKQIDISIRLHDIKKVVIINHEECGAYGEAGTYERHQQDLKNAKKQISQLYPQVKIKTYYLRKDGVFEEIA